MGSPRIPMDTPSPRPRPGRRNEAMAYAMPGPMCPVERLLGTQSVRFNLLSDCASIYLSICLSVYLFKYLSILSIYLSIYLPIYSIYMSVYLSICRSILGNPGGNPGIPKAWSITAWSFGTDSTLFTMENDHL